MAEIGEEIGGGAVRCLDRNYDLHRIDSTRCPECGRAFDPCDDRTVNPGRPMSRWSRWWLRPTRRWVDACSVVAGAAIVAAQHAPLNGEDISDGYMGGWYVYGPY